MDSFISQSIQVLWESYQNAKFDIHKHTQKIITRFVIAQIWLCMTIPWTNYHLLSMVVGIITDFLFSIHTYNYGCPLGLFLSLSFPTTQIEKKSISRVPFEKIVLPRSRGYCVTELVGSVCTAYNFHRVKMLVRIME